MQLAYTIGAQRSYDESLLDLENPPVKCGLHPEWDEPYGGGWIWRTAQEAADFIRNVGAAMGFNAAVYEVALPNGWAQDVSPHVGEDGVHRLLVDSRILRRV